MAKIMNTLQLSFVVALSVIYAPVLHAQALVKVDGSSTVFPVTEAVAEEFQAAEKGATRVTVGISGTGGGFKKFCRGEIDVSNASRPILAEELSLCQVAGINFYELPVAFDALTVMVNPQNNFLTKITVAELKKIWEPAAQGRVTTWDQVNSTWPHEPIKLYGAGSDSGTFDYFTEVIVGKAKASRGDYTASEDDNVLVQGIAHDVNALGYFGYAYYQENRDKLKALAIDGGGGPVLPSVESVLHGSYQPLSRPIFIYVSQQASQRPEVKRFVEFYIKNAATLVPEVKYISLPLASYPAILGRFQQGMVGTAFTGGANVGVKIDELLKRPLH